MTRLQQIQTAFPEHWRRILECMCPVWRSIYLLRDADPDGAASALRGAFDWQRSQEGYAFWARLAQQAEHVFA